MAKHRSRNGGSAFPEPEFRFFSDIREALSLSESGLVILCLDNASRGWGPNLGEGYMVGCFQTEVYPTLREMVKDIPVVAIGVGNSWMGLLDWLGFDMSGGSPLVYQLRGMGIILRRGVVVMQDGQVVAVAENEGWLSSSAHDYARSLATCLAGMADEGNGDGDETPTDQPASDEDGDETPDAAWDREVISAFQTLGVSANATFEEVRSAYRGLSRQFHPDVVAGKGLNQEFLRFAERRFREIKAAYDVLCEAFGQR